MHTPSTSGRLPEFSLKVSITVRMPNFHLTDHSDMAIWHGEEYFSSLTGTANFTTPELHFKWVLNEKPLP